MSTQQMSGSRTGVCGDKLIIKGQGLFKSAYGDTLVGIGKTVFTILWIGIQQDLRLFHTELKFLSLVQYVHIIKAH